MALTSRQQEIIGAAGRLLTTSGLSGLTIKNLAREMHFAESAIYRHFKSKEDIIVSMLQYLAENIENQLERIDPGLPPEESMKQLLEGQFRFFKTHSHFVMAVFSDGLMEESLLINKQILNLIQIKTKYLSPLIIKGQQNGSFITNISSEQLVHVIMGTFKLEILKWRMAGFGYDLQKAGDEMIRTLLILIKKQKPC